MSQIFEDSTLGTLTWRPTPWDEKVFGLNTVEILDLNCSTEEKGGKLLQQFQDTQEIGLLYGRFDASDQFLKKVLLADGFFQCETALSVRKNKLATNELPKLVKGRELELQQTFREGDEEHIIEQSGKMYNFSRFHEDPFINRKDADKRMSNWARQLLESDTPVLFHRDKKKNITSYLFYTKEGSEAHMLLGGSLPGYGMYAPFFFGGVLEQFKSLGIKAIKTSLSAANKGILSLYITLGFNVTSTKSDYHKHLIHK
ncbi:hypothetical protein [Gracilimonas mengyeensis]|uniref:N-acetyltransferase domain-containing protein n=1 Tax=Gracilimonas mengyeensis TaxID=1302730 RepID=A0A521FI66_9BACT|nr:hypothetical protein [Gracilimonas mengyeensis]SMO95912.1 hypothetical protein SAMN06265219_11960 [Gracilimonas mengyeensis]